MDWYAGLYVPMPDNQGIGCSPIGATKPIYVYCRHIRCNECLFDDEEYKEWLTSTHPTRIEFKRLEVIALLT